MTNSGKGMDSKTASEILDHILRSPKILKQLQRELFTYSHNFTSDLAVQLDCSGSMGPKQLKAIDWLKGQICMHQSYRACFISLMKAVRSSQNISQK